MNINIEIEEIKMNENDKNHDIEINKHDKEKFDTFDDFFFTGLWRCY